MIASPRGSTGEDHGEDFPLALQRLAPGWGGVAPLVGFSAECHNP